MRIGRIILALLAPLLSFSPALRAETAAENKQPEANQLGHRFSVLGLADFLRLASPHVTGEVRADLQTPYSFHAAPMAIFSSVRASGHLLSLLRAEKAAALQLFSRQQQPLPLRC